MLNKVLGGFAVAQLGQKVSLRESNNVQLPQRCIAMGKRNSSKSKFLNDDDTRMKGYKLGFGRAVETSKLVTLYLFWVLNHHA